MTLSVATIVAASLPAIAWLSWSGGTPSVLLVSPVLLFLLLRASHGKSKKLAAKGSKGRNEDFAGYEDPLRWSFLPSNGILRANTPQVCEVENDSLICKGLAIHRPTHDHSLEASGEYPYSWHMAGRKRLWEIRLQIRFKRVPESHLFFGLELGRYVHVGGGGATRVQSALVSSITHMVGEDFYHSPGDDPAQHSGECEPPTCVFPLWAFDQFAVSEIGQEPNITGDMEGVGRRRTDGVSAYMKAMNETVKTLSTDKVYTFCFWGVSQFFDCMAWEVNFWGYRLDFNRLCGEAPVYVAMYELKDNKDKTDKRHLLSLKKYLLHVAMWSDQKPPSKSTLQRIIGEEALKSSASGKKTRKGESSGWFVEAFGCCSSRDEKN